MNTLHNEERKLQNTYKSPAGTAESIPSAYL